MKQLIISILLISLSVSAAPKAQTFNDYIDSSIGINSRGKFGWFPVSSVAGNEAFYWFVQSQSANPKAPL